MIKIALYMERAYAYELENNSKLRGVVFELINNSI